MADPANRNRESERDDLPRGGADEQIRGIGDEADEEFEDAEDVDDEEEEDEEGTL